MVNIDDIMIKSEKHPSHEDVTFEELMDDYRKIGAKYYNLKGAQHTYQDNIITDDKRLNDLAMGIKEDMEKFGISPKFKRAFFRKFKENRIDGEYNSLTREIFISEDLKNSTDVQIYNIIVHELFHGSDFNMDETETEFLTNAFMAKAASKGLTKYKEAFYGNVFHRMSRTIAYKATHTGLPKETEKEIILKHMMGDPKIKRKHLFGKRIPVIKDVTKDGLYNYSFAPMPT